jgi:hypothetical protein
MNVATALAAGRLGRLRPDLDRIASPSVNPTDIVQSISDRLFAGGLSAHTMEVITREAADAPGGIDPRAYAIGLALGGPEFQRQ